MRATIIDFKKKVIDIPEYKPIINMRSIIDPMGRSANYFGGSEKVYQEVLLESIDRLGRKRVSRYFVNKEDVEIAFPIIKAMVQERTKHLDSRHYGDTKAMEAMMEDIEYLRLPWWKKLVYKRKLGIDNNAKTL